MTSRVIVQKLSQKEGVSQATGKQYVKYGLQDATGTWYNSFHPINAIEGGEYMIEFQEGKFGNDLKSIVPVDKTENQTANKNRNGSIVRQHSQEMSLRYLVAQGKPFDLNDVKEVTDWFVEDVEGTEMPFKRNGSKPVTEEEIDIDEIPF